MAGGLALPGDPDAAVRWHGPDLWGAYWHERDGGAGLSYRIHVSPATEGLALRLNMVNGRRRPPRPALRHRRHAARGGRRRPAARPAVGQRQGDRVAPLDAPAGGAALRLQWRRSLPGETRSLTGTLTA